jgi:hypothetical protein
MRNIARALEAAELRKQAAGVEAPSGTHLKFTSGEDMDRAIFSGFDIEYDELLQAVDNASWFFVQAALSTGLSTLFKACWSDGLLTGLMLAQQVAPHHTSPGDKEVTGGDPSNA